MTQAQTTPQNPLQHALQPDLFDLYRAGLRTAAEMMKASLENAERLQNQQLVVIRSALDQQSRSLGELGQARNLDELMALQTRMAGAQMERAMGLWTSLWQMAGENQMAVIGQMQSQMAQARDMMAGAASAALKPGARQEARKAA
jgi:phasin family protein